MTGLESVDNVSLQISNMVRDAIKPDLTMFLHYKTIEIEEKQVLEIEIQRGTERPYYIAKKGLRPEGVYVRQGYSSVPANDTAIKRMIKETDGDRFEEMRSLEQNLTFVETSREFARRNVEFGLHQMKTLKLLNYDGIYTNLGLLLSEQCKHTIKVAVFQGTDQSVFKDRREFSGSLFKQLNEVYEYIDMHNQTQSTFNKLLRIDTRDYPEDALREALLNLMVHRDYGFQASALISIYEDRIEFVSVGGLVSGIDLEDIMMGISVCRNQNLANVFYRLQLIEAYGTGIRKILNAYHDVKQKPEIQHTQNAFKIILPNRNQSLERKEEYEVLSKTEQQIIELMKQNGKLSRKEIETKLELSTSTALRLLKKLTEKNLVVQNREGRKVNYHLIEN